VQLVPGVLFADMAAAALGLPLTIRQSIEVIVTSTLHNGGGGCFGSRMWWCADEVSSVYRKTGVEGVAAVYWASSWVSRTGSFAGRVNFI